MRSFFAHLSVAGWCLAVTPLVLAQYERPTQPADPGQMTEPGKSLPLGWFEPPAPQTAATPVSQPRNSRPTTATAQYQAPRQAGPPEEVLPEYTGEEWVDEAGWEDGYGSYEAPHGGDDWGHGYNSCHCEYCCNPWSLSVDFLSMQPRFSDHDFALVDPNTDSQPDGAFSNLDSGRANGLQLHIGRQVLDEWDLAVRYTYLVNTNSHFVQAPANGQLWATMAHPNTVNVANTADAGLKFKYHVLDADLGRDLDLTPTLDTRVFGGWRFAWIDHDVHVLYNGGDAVFDQVLSPLRFSGYGLRLGGQTNWRLPAGWSLFGEASTALLVGTIDTSLLESNNGGTVTIVNITDRQTFGTPVLELGIGATRTWGPWELRAGYKLSHWFNVLQRRDFSDDLHAGKPMTRSSDLMLDGFFVGLGLGR